MRRHHAVLDRRHLVAARAPGHVTLRGFGDEIIAKRQRLVDVQIDRSGLIQTNSGRLVRVDHLHLDRCAAVLLRRRHGDGDRAFLMGSHDAVFDSRHLVAARPPGDLTLSGFRNQVIAQRQRLVNVEAYRPGLVQRNARRLVRVDDLDVQRGRPTVVGRDGDARRALADRLDDAVFDDGDARVAAAPGQRTGRVGRSHAGVQLEHLTDGQLRRAGLVERDRLRPGQVHGHLALGAKAVRGLGGDHCAARLQAGHVSVCVHRGDALVAAGPGHLRGRVGGGEGGGQALRLARADRQARAAQADGRGHLFDDRHLRRPVNRAVPGIDVNGRRAGLPGLEDGRALRIRVNRHHARVAALPNHVLTHARFIRRQVALDLDLFPSVRLKRQVAEHLHVPDQRRLHAARKGCAARILPEDREVHASHFRGDECVARLSVGSLQGHHVAALPLAVFKAFPHAADIPIGRGAAGNRIAHRELLVVAHRVFIKAQAYRRRGFCLRRAAEGGQEHRNQHKAHQRRDQFAFHVFSSPCFSLLPDHIIPRAGQKVTIIFCTFA